LALVESQLLSLQDVTIATSALSRSRRDDSEKTTGLELLLQSRLDLSLASETSSMLLLNRLALLRIWLSDISTSLQLASATEVLAIMCLIPLSERSSVDLDNGRSGEGVGSDEFVVGRMESDDDDSDLAGDALRGPGEVAGFETESTKLSVTTTGADEMDSLGSDTSIGLLSAGFESALLPCKILSWIFSGWNTCQLRHMGFLLRTVICSLGTSGRALVSAVS
jgi:hypothetical protein